jgi:hypothetical protein
LIVNEFKDLDKGADWAAVDGLFPDVKMEDIQTATLSKNTDNLFLRGPDNHTQGTNADPAKDFNFVKVLYHNTNDLGKHLTFEAEKWKPMIQKAMNEGKTTMKGWGNAQIVAPESGKFPYSAYSYDIFSTLHEALAPAFVEGWEFPEGFFDDVDGIYEGPRHVNIYRVVAVVTPDM